MVWHSVHSRITLSSVFEGTAKPLLQIFQLLGCFTYNAIEFIFDAVLIFLKT